MEAEVVFPSPASGFVVTDCMAYLERLFADPSRVTRQLVDDILKFKRVDGVCEAMSKVAGNFIADKKQAVVLRDRLDQIQVPMLVIWGDQDQIIPRSHTENLPERCTVEVLSNCGHMVPMEAAGKVNRLISRFLK